MLILPCKVLMMKTILLIRHGHAVAGGGIPDVDRPLSETGKRQATAMAMVIQRRGASPDLVICSPAKRTRETARGLAAGWNYPPERIVTEGVLYQGGSEEYTNVLEAVSDEYGCVALVAHNPVIGHMATLFSSGIIETFHPCSVAAFQVHSDHWSGLEAADKRLLFLEVPPL